MYSEPSEEITLEMQLEYIERLPVIESQKLQRFRGVTNPSYHLTTLKKNLLKEDRFLQTLSWINQTFHRAQNLARKINFSEAARAEKP